MQDHMPFAVIGGNSVANINGKKVRARAYPWGAVNIEDESVSDFAYLRDVLIQYVGRLSCPYIMCCYRANFAYLRDTCHSLC
jgi:hypothetical protein